MTTWNRDERLSWMISLSKKTADQKMIIQLTDKQELSSAEKTLLDSLWTADKLKFKAREAERRTSEIFRTVQDASRKRQNHAKICIGIAALQLAAENATVTMALLQKLKSIENVDEEAVVDILRSYHARFPEKKASESTASGGQTS
ncbi:hypothetical protein [Herbaspirillum huttiense]|uniref:Uncharacterized protein n=1 Tax=Herbaspirillum huttiense subsp. lycopersici TaxID=3074428 RepID=A0ABU2ERT4_9BURK|nr:hypothetical protein [Herbaspirillum huttiense]MDR9850884.1 hypothetical protein [Herbaspirillum huttiense SE1]